MKKNLISILILALLVVNLILTTVMMFATMSSVKKTSALVSSIASVLNIEINGSAGNETEENNTVTMADTDIYNIEDEIMIALKKGDDEKPHYCQVKVSLLMNKKHEDYAANSASLATSSSVIQGIVNDVIASYTYEEVQTNRDAITQEILLNIQQMYGSTFVYGITFSKFLPQ